MSTPDPSAYPHRTLFVSLDLDAPFYTVLIEEGAEPDALQLDLMRDALVAQSHVLMVSRDRASLALFAASFKRLVEQAALSTH